jgi:hypothetical protein
LKTNGKTEKQVISKSIILESKLNTIKPNMEFEFECDYGMLKARYEDMSKIVINEIKEWRKEQRKIFERMEKEKKKEQNKPILIEKPVKNEKSQPILITRVNKFEEEPSINPSKIIETSLKKTEPIKIDESNTENKVADAPTSTPKIDGKIVRTEEQPKVETKTFKERRKEISYYDDLFDEWEVPEEEEMKIMCETMDILLDIEEAILEGEPKPVKYEYFESDNDPPMGEFTEFLQVDLKLLSDTMIK